MLATAVRRGDLRFPTEVFDDFVRADSRDLGSTPVGLLPWKQLRGTWRIRNNRLHMPTFGTSAQPLTVVDARRSNVKVEITGVNNVSGDAVAFRVADGENFLVLRMFYSVAVIYTVVTQQAWLYTTTPVSTDGGITFHSHDYTTWEVDGPNDFREQHGHPAGHHGTPVASPLPVDSRDIVTGSTVDPTRILTLDRVEGGVETQLGFWGIPLPSGIGVEVSGDQIQPYRITGSGDRVDMTGGPVTSSFNQTETHHGVAARMGGQPGNTNINTFFLTSS